MDKSKKMEYTRKEISAINKTIENVMISNAMYAEKNCIGYDDSNCQNISLTPQLEDNGKSIVFYTKNEEALEPVKTYCGLEEQKGEKHKFICYDGRGKRIKFEQINPQTLGKDYLLPYKGQYYKIKIITSVFSKEKTFTDIENFLITKTLQKEIDISNAIKKFVRVISLKEYANDCSDGGTSVNPPNGLGSWDDALIPWVWRIVSQNTQQLCTGSADGDSNSCGCKLFQDESKYWETNPYYCIINSADTWSRVLNNLGLGSIYRTDGFGNKLVMSMLSDSNGNPQDCAPKPPQRGYYYSPTFPKVRIGLTENCQKSVTGNSFDGVCDWYAYIDIYTE